MKKNLLIVSAIVFLFSCKNTVPPKDVAKEFIEAVYTGNAAKASVLVTEKTKTSVTALTVQTPGMSAEESFSLNMLNESENGNTAEVKNDLIKVSLEKEGDGWKVAAAPDLVASISNRDEDLMALKTRWEALLKEYESRLQIAKEYVQYKKGQGALSPQMHSLEQMVTTLSAKTTWDKEKIQLYVQRQQQLLDMIDKALEPSFAANTDMTMNYILQLSGAADRIKLAKQEYQALAEKTPSATYPSLAMK